MEVSEGKLGEINRCIACEVTRLPRHRCCNTKENNRTADVMFGKYKTEGLKDADADVDVDVDETAAD